MIDASLYNDPAVVALERKIYDYSATDSEEREDLILERQLLLDKKFVLSEENKQLLADANAAMRQALTSMRHRVIEIYNQTKQMRHDDERFCVSGACVFYGYAPDLHPLSEQEHTWLLYEALCKGRGWLTDKGIHGSAFSLPGDPIDQDDEGFLTLGNYDSWNEGLDREATDDMMLIRAISFLHNVAHFSWLDIILFRDFETQIRVCFDKGKDTRVDLD